MTIPLSLLSVISEIETLGEIQYVADEELRKARQSKNTLRISRAKSKRVLVDDKRKIVMTKLEKELLSFRDTTQLN